MKFLLKTVIFMDNGFGRRFKMQEQLIIGKKLLLNLDLIPTCIEPMYTKIFRKSF
jgi:hypothetical protein